MLLATEDQGDLPEITEEILRRVLNDDAFGGFAILSQSQDEFIQAGCQWSTSDECAAFVKAHGSDPWIVEFRDPVHATPIPSTRLVTLHEVVTLFAAYLRRDPAWRSLVPWEKQP